MEFATIVSGKENTNITIGNCYARKSSEQSKVYWIDNFGARYNGKTVMAKNSNNEWSVTNTLEIIGESRQHQEFLHLIFGILTSFR